MSESIFVLQEPNQGLLVTSIWEDLCIERSGNGWVQIIRIRGNKNGTQRIIFDYPWYRKDRYLTVSNSAAIAKAVEIDVHSEWSIYPLCTQGISLDEKQFNWQPVTGGLNLDYSYSQNHKIMCVIKSKSNGKFLVHERNGKLRTMDLTEENAQRCIWILKCIDNGRTVGEKWMLGIQVTSLALSVGSAAVSAFAKNANNVANLAFFKNPNLYGVDKVNWFTKLAVKSPQLVKAANYLCVKKLDAQATWIAGALSAAFGVVFSVSEFLEPDNLERLVELYKCSELLDKALKSLGFIIEGGDRKRTIENEEELPSKKQKK
eukprot:NODE_5062_length_1074_cov_64.768665_g4506_i0.p1 GENE.NODE_5062_length_1074_cov_64.768665_g4506_i0~~NODE_5062_length_1074_cov_64.768665_g4506_i0.p1  ORF type:complete len:334 (-),score=47.71 NODE_5062_length_1074_cov_64.768665_g4506_i0:72-1025(-)